ncbi:MAG TPA: 5'-methylthioadenosine/adenosylhomocysteine nucleosidase [Clostridiales bacterium]|nr:5'-methylthioadenosine/adenosylhomocysteine nucleosidase [Clostridiales bacterium]
MRKIGIIVAMESELAGFTEKLQVKEVLEYAKKSFYIFNTENYEVIVVLSGIGKVNASISATLLLSKFNVDMVISTGVAGGLEHIKQKTIVIAKSLVQHDLDTTAFGDPLGLIPHLNCIEIKSNEKLVDFLHKEIKDSRLVTLASGDQFVCSKKRAGEIKSNFNATACDMESAAIAQVCAFFDVPFVAIRLISDSAGDGAESEYSFNLEESAKGMAFSIVDLLPKLAKVDL